MASWEQVCWCEETYLVKQQKVNFAGTYECVPLQRLPLYSLLSDKNKLKVCSPFSYGKYWRFHSMRACISVTNSKRYKDACFY